MIRGAEVALPRLQNIEFRAFLEVLDDFWRFRRFELVDGLRHDLDGDVIAPGLVFRRLEYFLENAATNAFEPGVSIR